MSARDTILSKLRQRTVLSEPLPVDSAVIEQRDWSDQDLSQRFCEQLRANHAEVIETTTEELADSIVKQLVRHKASTLLVGRQSPYIGLLQQKKPDSLEIVEYHISAEQWQEALFHSTDAALTSTKGGIAETGSLLLWPSKEEPRLMSLVPPLHLAVVNRSELFETFAHAIKQQAWAKHLPTNVLLVSGPSKTADIEQTLVYGAHGPCELVVFLVD